MSRQLEKKKKFNERYTDFLLKKHNANVSSNKVVYIHIPKCAGNAIKDAIGGFEGDSHLPASGIPEFAFKEFKSASFVRNPYDRCVSAYFYLLTGGDGGKQDLYDKTKYISRYASFEDFVINGLDQASIEQQHFFHQFRFLDREVDFIGKYERLYEDFFKLCKNFKIKHNNIKNKNKFSLRNYTPLYSNKMLQKIQEIYQEDFERFQYNNILS